MDLQIHIYIYLHHWSLFSHGYSVIYSNCAASVIWENKYTKLLKLDSLGMYYSIHKNILHNHGTYHILTFKKMIWLHLAYGKAVDGLWSNCITGSWHARPEFLPESENQNSPRIFLKKILINSYKIYFIKIHEIILSKGVSSSDKCFLGDSWVGYWDENPS